MTSRARQFHSIETEGVVFDIWQRERGFVVTMNESAVPDAVDFGTFQTLDSALLAVANNRLSANASNDEVARLKDLANWEQGIEPEGFGNL